MFALSGLLTLVLLGVVGVELLRRTSTNEAIRDAKRITASPAMGSWSPR